MKSIYGLNNLEENKLKSKFLLGLAFIPMIFTLFVLRFLPDMIPAHYDTLGNIDRYGSKYELLILPGVIVIFNILWIILLNYFKSKEEKSQNELEKVEAIQNAKIMFYVAIGTWLLFTVLHFVLIVSATLSIRDELDTMAVNIGMVLSILTGLMFVIIGNILPKSRRNSLLGVRTKWSLSSDENWSKSNLFGGLVLMVAGILIIVESFIFNNIWSVIVMLIILALSTIIMIWYSWLVDKKTTKRS